MLTQTASKPLDITGSVVTIDAIGGQKTITELIITKKADYVIGLKANQDGLYKQVSDWFERMKPTLQASVSRDSGHGRGEKRTVWLSEKSDISRCCYPMGWTQKCRLRSVKPLAE